MGALLPEEIGAIPSTHFRLKVIPKRPWSSPQQKSHQKHWQKHWKNHLASLELAVIGKLTESHHKNIHSCHGDE